jgi:hypothetical protein
LQRFLHRMGQPEKLASASHVNGVTLPVDGGTLAA